MKDQDDDIILICEQSFQMTRRMALTSYAYPTLKFMGYNDIKVLTSHAF